MDANFWHQKWEKGEIGFHKIEVNPHLRQFFGKLSVNNGGRIFLPLCGKTFDISWFVAAGYRVAGVELSPLAVDQLFFELGVEPTKAAAGHLQHYSAPNIDIFVGDVFDVSGAILGPIDAVYDRAAFIALPADMRNRYTNHLMEITKSAPQLLISLEYDQTVVDGPPFSISHEEVRRHYGHRYSLDLIFSVDVPDGLKGKWALREDVWVLRPPDREH